MRIERTIVMKPFGKARPRFYKGHVTMPKGYQAKKKRLKKLFGKVDIEGWIKLSVTAYRPIPESRVGKVQQGQYTGMTPDVDNIAGAVMDALFPDDRRVVELFCTHVWGDFEGLKIIIESAQ